MKRNLAGALAVLIAVEMHAAPAAACGIKLVVKTSTPHRSIARSSNPSHLLLLGTPPHRLERELAAAGHDVEVEPTVSAAKASSYAVVVVDAKQADESRAKFSTAVVIVRSGDITADIASVESQVARKPARTQESRPVVAAREARRPVAAGPPVPSHPIIAAKEPTPEAPVESTPSVATPSVATTVQPPAVERAPSRPVATPTQKPVVAATAAASSHDELYFSLGSAAVRRKDVLDRAVRWLTASADVHVVIEGYADPTGNHDANMVLGQHRAESVRDYLASAGIDGSRMEVISYGDTRLKYGRTDGRNRRVAIQPKH
jgi:peptidoglycan-associated lipoprotein